MDLIKIERFCEKIAYHFFKIDILFQEKKKKLPFFKITYVRKKFLKEIYVLVESWTKCFHKERQVIFLVTKFLGMIFSWKFLRVKLF